MPKSIYSSTLDDRLIFIHVRTDKCHKWRQIISMTNRHQGTCNNSIILNMCALNGTPRSFHHSEYRGRLQWSWVDGWLYIKDNTIGWDNVEAIMFPRGIKAVSLQQICVLCIVYIASQVYGRGRKIVWHRVEGGKVEGKEKKGVKVERWKMPDHRGRAPWRAV